MPLPIRACRLQVTLSFITLMLHGPPAFVITFDRNYLGVSRARLTPTSPSAHNCEFSALACARLANQFSLRRGRTRTGFTRLLSPPSQDAQPQAPGALNGCPSATRLKGLLSGSSGMSGRPRTLSGSRGDRSSIRTQPIAQATQDVTRLTDVPTQCLMRIVAQSNLPQGGMQ